MSKTMFANQFGFRSNDLDNQGDADPTHIKGNAIHLYFDLGKGFDTLDPNILLAKLECYGIRGVPLRLIRSYP